MGLAVAKLAAFRGIGTLTALGLIAEIGDFARFSHPRELHRLAGDHAQRVLLRRAATTRAHYPCRQPPRPPAAVINNGTYLTRFFKVERCLSSWRPPRPNRSLIEAAWHCRHAPRRPTSGPEPPERAWQAQIRLFHRNRHLTAQGKRSTVVTVAIARELSGFCGLR